jgi:hypothetical protein
MPQIPHETDEQLELYALHRLPDDRIEAVEEHLLVCAVCQERLNDVEAFATAMRDAIGTEPVLVPRRPWFQWLRAPAVAWGGAFAIIIVAIGLYMSQSTRSSRGSAIAPVASFQLTAVRGEIPSVAPALETDITLTDLPAENGLRAELVDASGGVVWNGNLTPAAGHIRISKQLSQGAYFVRLYNGGGKLLHEYGFRVQGTP